MRRLVAAQSALLLWLMLRRPPSIGNAHRYKRRTHGKTTPHTTDS